MNEIVNSTRFYAKKTRDTHDLASLSRNAHESAPVNDISVFHIDRARRRDAGTSRDATTMDVNTNKS